uniref:Uncharacterized protein n=1 Tax=Ditylenchus dipsaci TaxID=166011 RepID=A0A915EB87_9BILA
MTAAARQARMLRRMSRFNGMDPNATADGPQNGRRFGRRFGRRGRMGRFGNNNNNGLRQPMAFRQGWWEDPQNLTAVVPPAATNLK